MKITLIPGEENILKIHIENMFVWLKVKHTGTEDLATPSGSCGCGRGQKLSLIRYMGWGEGAITGAEAMEAESISDLAKSGALSFREQHQLGAMVETVLAFGSDW